MKLQRWHVARGGLDQGDCLDERGEWVRWADVLAWRDSIRAAVAAERAAGAGIPHPYGDCGECDEWHDEAREALDALLAGVER